MLRNFWKKLDNATFPKPTGADYAKDAFELSEYEYFKSLDAIDFAITNAEYHRRRIERYKVYAKDKSINYQAGGGAGSVNYYHIDSDYFNKSASGNSTV